MTKVSKLEIKAVIPTRQYENIQPLIEFKDCDLEESTNIAMKYINDLMAQYSEKGPLKSRLGAVTTTVKLKSFNEDGVVVDFDPIAHTYHYKGKQLISATNYLKKFYKPFEKEAVAANCEKAWGVSKEDIIDLWDSNGEVANMLGTLIHKALEHSELFRETGITIANNRKTGENPALLKHPLLRGIIEGFQEMYVAAELPMDKVFSEVLLTDVKGGFCGQADRLVQTDTKKFRVQDHKINVEATVEDPKKLKPAAPFAHLAPNKLAKYQIQMSIYANMLQKSGLEVEYLDAFVLDEEWTHYPLPVLNVLE